MPFAVIKAQVEVATSMITAMPLQHVENRRLMMESAYVIDWAELYKRRIWTDLL
jgi:hypothetical protein